MAADYGHFADGSSVPGAPNITIRSQFRGNSVDAELLLQARRRGRVLEYEPLVRIDITVRFLRHQRAFVEAAQDQLELARIGVDVADGEDAGDVGLERLGLDRDQVFLELDAPVAHRTEL